MSARSRRFPWWGPRRPPAPSPADAYYTASVRSTETRWCCPICEHLWFPIDELTLHMQLCVGLDPFKEAGVIDELVTAEHRRFIAQGVDASNRLRRSILRLRRAILEEAVDRLAGALKGSDP